MNNEYIPKITPAVSKAIIPIICLSGLSGGGKTRSALMLARGMVGAAGKIRVIDTENGRASYFKNDIPGGYDTIDLPGPFSPENYLKAMKHAVQEKTDILVIDSMTHEWDGEGGVLEMQEGELDRLAKNDLDKRERVKMLSWVEPKAQHKKFVREILRVPIPVILCFRGQEKTHMVKDKTGRMVVVTDNFCTPIFDKNFFFEALISAETYHIDGKGGYLHVMKITHEDLWKALPKIGEQAEQLNYVHGERIMAWCKAAGARPAAAGSKATDTPAIRALKKELWDATDKKHLGDKKALQQWLWDESLMLDTENLETGVPEARLREIVDKAKQKLKAPQP